MRLLDDPTLGLPVHQARKGTLGRVTLLGAGPGDPDLLTVKAARVLRSASLVLHDHLVGDRVLDLLPATATRIYVGKESAQHTMSQDSIIELMLRLAREGRSVVRLKGGDGYVFGRGGEEAQALAEADIPFEVIPGITAAQGAAASVGIPLTHRGHAGTLIYVTGHGKGDEPADLDWDLLSRPRQTVVIYMGVGSLTFICERLVAHGMDPGTPAALVERATLPEERCVCGTVATLPALAALHHVRPPALIVIGTVVSLQPLLSAAAVAGSVSSP